MDTMDTTEERIWLYPFLAQEEREEVEAYVREHPQWEATLASARRLGALVVEARRAQGVPDDEDAIAFVLAAKRLSRRPLPDRFARALDRLEAAAAQDAHLAGVVASLEARLDALAASFDAAAHFEKLTGRRPDGTAPGDPRDEPAPERPAPLRRSAAWKQWMGVVFLGALG